MSETYGLGDMVWSCIELRNDGTIPDLPTDALLAKAGARGVIVKVGTIQDHPDISVFLVRFEDDAGELGHPVGCLTEELTQDEQLAKSLATGTPSSAGEPTESAEQNV